MYADLSRPPLHAEELRRALLRGGSPWREIRVVDTTVSTNADVVAAARGGAAAGLVVAAERQTGGRGRQAREWVSPPQAGLTFSVLLRPSVPVTRWGWLPLLAGLALARAVGRLGAVPVRLKWPNDLLLGPERGKAAGLLAEVTGAAVVVGVGLNVSTRRGELPHGATSLAVEAAACTDRMPLLIATLRDIAADYERWQAAGGDPEASGLRAGYLAICDTVGRAVAVSIPGGRTMTGEAVDVDGDGRLVVQDPAGLRTPLAAGDVLHVRPTTAP